MQVSYNLRYQKSNFSNKVILDKEGEVVIYGKGFRLKGKGATDKGELINFSEIKEFYYRSEKIIFITFAKEKYVLSDMGTLFDQLLIDLYKARNEFLMDALFMKGGKLKSEFEGDFQRVSKFGKLINKGSAKFRLHERSLVIVPPDQDAFSIYYDFVSFHEFEDFEYSAKIVMDDGTTITFSKLGNDYDLFQERINELLGGMYEALVNGVFKEAFQEFHAATLLKLAYKMKSGKGVSLKDIRKIDPELALAVENFVFEDQVFVEKTNFLREMTNDYEIFYGISGDKTVQGGFIKWAMFAIPSKNIVAFSILPRWEKASPENHVEHQHDTYFFRIIMEKGNPADKVEDKVREINQALITLDFAKDPCYKDKKELRHSPYQYAIRKLAFLRILRKSYVGRVASADPKEWKKQADDILRNAELK
jgi:hypothetical protein